MKSRPVNPASYSAVLIAAVLVCAGLIGQYSRAVSAMKTAPAASATMTSFDRDSDGDGLSDFAEVHKYFTDPNRRSTAGDSVADGDTNRRKEFTYTITEVVRVLKPCNPAAMNDDYQDVRVLSRDADSYTLEVTLYPLNTNADAIGEDFNWRRDDAGMTRYLKPTVTCNWDARMQSELVAELRQDGIDPDRLSDKQLVTQVSAWAMKTSKFEELYQGNPIDWFVDFPNGKPEVYPPLRTSFDAARPDPSWSDEKMLDRELYGKSMFAAKVHGSCTSSAIYLATIFRALGIPTRILYFIPPADYNDPAQRAMLLSGIHHCGVRAAVAQALAAASGGAGFCNHMYDEVFVGGRWARLNYDKLGQNIVDPNYNGLMMHIDTCADISETDLARTWGVRGAKYPGVTPRLTSVNPYQLISISDHFGRWSHVPNPYVEYKPFEYTTVTINGVYPPNTAQYAELITDDFLTKTLKPNKLVPDFMIGIAEAPQGAGLPMREFLGRASNRFTLHSPGHPDVGIACNSVNCNDNKLQAFGAAIAPADRGNIVPGAVYTIEPINTSTKYKWTVGPGVTFTAP
jgi:hypothetical protein